MGQPRDQASIIRAILEGTAGETGHAFFAALVRNVASALGVAGAWVTEYLAEPRRLRALAFWFDDRFVPDYEYPIAGTPCEPVIDRGRLLHIPDRAVDLFPRDADLKDFRAVSYLGMPLFDGDGTVLGHLAAIDTRPTALDARIEAVFRIFAARAAAELRRLRAEAATREREEQLSRLLDSAMDGVIELDDDLRRTYDVPPYVKVVVLEPGEDPTRFGDRRLEKGTGIWMVGGQAVGGLRALLDDLHRMASHANGRSHVTSVRWDEGTPRTHTLHLRLTSEEIEDLASLREGLPTEASAR